MTFSKLYLGRSNGAVAPNTQLRIADGMTSESAYKILEKDYDPVVAEKEAQWHWEQVKAGVLEQAQRCDLMLQRLPIYAAGAHTWGDKGSALALSRSKRLTHSPLPVIADSFRRQLVSKKNAVVAKIVTYKHTTPVGEVGNLTYGAAPETLMLGEDFRKLLQFGAFISDATIYFYSALLMQRDHALALAYPDSWERSWIFGVHFYTNLLPPDQPYQYGRVERHGSKSPGTKNPWGIATAICHMPNVLSLTNLPFARSCRLALV